MSGYKRIRLTDFATVYDDQKRCWQVLDVNGSRDTDSWWLSLPERSRIRLEEKLSECDIETSGEIKYSDMETDITVYVIRVW